MNKFKNIPVSFVAKVSKTTEPWEDIQQTDTVNKVTSIKRNKRLEKTELLKEMLLSKLKFNFVKCMEMKENRVGRSLID